MTTNEQAKEQILLMKKESELKQKRFRFEVLAMAQEAATRGNTVVDPAKVVEIGKAYMEFISSETASPQGKEILMKVE